MTRQQSPTSVSHPVILGQSGHDLLVNFKFVLQAPWTACRICGAIVQTDLDRLAYALCMEFPDSPDDYLPTYEESCRIREEWRIKHERTFHTDKEIAALEKSGLAITPEAAYNLAPYGIIPVGDAGGIYMSETDHALFEARRAPRNDAEGS